MGASLVLARHWQLGKCSSSLSVPVLCTAGFETFLFYKRGSYPTTCPACLRGLWEAAQKGTSPRVNTVPIWRSDAGCNQELRDQRSNRPALRFSAFLLSHCSIRLFFRLIIASHTARKEIFLCNKNSFGVFTAFSSMQNRKAWHIAFYGYKRSRLRFLMFLDNCAHNNTTTLS